jgi:hypothetical protein
MVAPESISGHGCAAEYLPPAKPTLASFPPSPLKMDHRRGGLTDERRIIGGSLTERSTVSVLNAMSFANMQPTMM